MLDEVRQVLDPNEQLLARVPFGRNRLLRALGVALFTSVAQFLLPKPALAACGAPTPYPCSGLSECPRCSGPNCTSSGCTKRRGLCPSLGGSNCWSVCTNGRLYSCCDWTASCGSCICSAFVQSMQCG